MKKIKLLFSSLLFSLLCAFNSFADLVVSGIPHKSSVAQDNTLIICVIAIIVVVLAVVGLIIFIKRKNKGDDSHSDGSQSHQNGSESI